MQNVKPLIEKTDKNPTKNGPFRLKGPFSVTGHFHYVDREK